jgi:hypothetical protein
MYPIRKYSCTVDRVLGRYKKKLLNPKKQTNNYAVIAIENKNETSILAFTKCNSDKPYNN